MAHALVPLKDLVRAKTRLAGLLRPSERRALAQAMAEDVLATLSSHPDISGITLVSDDPGAGLLAGKYDSAWWAESSLGCRGLNNVITAATRRLALCGEPPLLVLHADLPLLTVADISVVLAAWQELDGLVIGCDRGVAGTNLLAFDATRAPQFRFGPGSCARHQGSARELGMPVRVLQRPGIALDVDEPGDLLALLTALEHGGGEQTLRLLCGTRLGSRISLALASLLDTGSERNEDCLN